jgi:hypothetical protein
MVLVAVVIGTAVAAAATERLTIDLAVASALAWAFVPVIQLVTGCWLVRGTVPGRRMTALERYFDTHRPWSLFILAFHGLLLAWPPARAYMLLLAPLAAIPIVLTALALTRMCRDVLGMAARDARRSVAIHQAMTYLVVLAYAAWASAYLPRLVGLLS